MNLQKIYSGCLHTLYSSMIKQEFQNEEDKEKALNVILSAIKVNEMTDYERDKMEAQNN